MPCRLVRPVSGPVPAVECSETSRSLRPTRGRDVNVLDRIKDWVARDGRPGRPPDGEPVGEIDNPPGTTDAQDTTYPEHEGMTIREERTTDPADMPLAQGQELLGPCRGCDGFWTREIVRGQKPSTCPVCKRDGPPGG